MGLAWDSMARRARRRCAILRTTRLAVGPNHIVQIVNSRMAIFTKKGRQFDTTGKVLYGAVPTNNVFKGFGGPCEMRNNGDAVVRYDQLADRWLIVMPIFSRSPATPQDPPAQPPAPYSMCYALSTSADPFGTYYRYEFIRPLFPDYPRPAVWPDGYYLPTSTGDEVIQKHACVVDRAKMLEGKDATEQCVVVDGVNFLNNADLDGQALPPAGAPNIVMAAGGTQLRKMMRRRRHLCVEVPRRLERSGQDVKLDRADEDSASRPTTICATASSRAASRSRAPNAGSMRRATSSWRVSSTDASAIANRSSRRHSVNTTAGGGGVRWYEFSVDKNRDSACDSRAPTRPTARSDGWQARPSTALATSGSAIRSAGHRSSPANASPAVSPTTRSARSRCTKPCSPQARHAQTNTLRWEDYSQTAVDPSDDCTIWYVGDYFKKGAASYSTRIGAFRMPQCR